MPFIRTLVDKGYVTEIVVLWLIFLTIIFKQLYFPFSLNFYYAAARTKNQNDVKI